MADVHEPKVRSYNMSQIKSKNTKPEILVRKFLFSKGLRFRIHDQKLPGKPDIVLKKYNTIIFIHGCFWHGHKGCKYFVVPKTRTEWWLEKINKNAQNDAKNSEELIKNGWNTLTIWECELKPSKQEETLNQLVKNIK
jgi:DNA mismatch endonuclease, patch repair protein